MVRASARLYLYLIAIILPLLASTAFSQIQQASLTASLKNAEVQSLILVGDTGIPSGSGLDPRSSVDTWVYADGQISYRSDGRAMSNEQKNFAVGTAFQITSVKFKEDRLELKLKSSDRNSGRLMVMFGTGWQQQVTNATVIQTVEKFLNLSTVVVPVGLDKTTASFASSKTTSSPVAIALAPNSDSRQAATADGNGPVVSTKANAGDAPSQTILGLGYLKGESVPQDYSQAAYWLRKAADQEEPTAQVNLGHLYDHGQGVPKDNATAALWYFRAANQGNADAQYAIGFDYRFGQGVEQDYSQAADWLLKAAMQGQADAQLNLGVLYYYGQGVSQDLAQAVAWFRKAADQGNAEAQLDLGQCYLQGEEVPLDYAQAAAWFRKAAEQGNAVAQSRLGLLYLQGQGVPQDSVQAASWFRKAAEQGNVDGQKRLGIIYLLGGSVPQSPAEAYFWLDLALEQLTGAAKDDTKSIRDAVTAKLMPSELSLARERKSQWLAAHPALAQFPAEPNVPAPPTSANTNGLAQTPSRSADAELPSAESTNSASERMKFSAALTQQMRGSKDTDSSYATSGDQSETFEAAVPASVDVVSLLSNRFAAVLSQHGFKTIHIIMPDGNGHADEWIAQFVPNGYISVLSTTFCPSNSASSATLQYCSLQTDKPQQSPEENTRYFMAKALTDKSAKEGHNRVYSVQGKVGKSNVLYVVDKDAATDGFVQQSSVDSQWAKQLYEAGFRTFVVGDGRKGYWGAHITPSAFTPMHDGEQ